MFIQTESTPNENSLKFVPGKPVMKNNATLEILNYRDAKISPLAKELYKVDGIQSLYFAPDFITVTKDPTHEWHILKPDIFGIIMDFFVQDKPIISAQTEIESNKDTMILDGDTEVVQMIKELLETRIRPSIQEDGGDVEYMGYENEIVKLKLKGACRTCSSSTITLKSGIQAMLQHYIPEVKGVEQIQDELEELNYEVLSNFEKENKKH